MVPNLMGLLTRLNGLIFVNCLYQHLANSRHYGKSLLINEILTWRKTPCQEESPMNSSKKEQNWSQMKTQEYPVKQLSNEAGWRSHKLQNKTSLVFNGTLPLTVLL
jgi:hypothetical protein